MQARIVRMGRMESLNIPRKPYRPFIAVQILEFRSPRESIQNDTLGKVGIVLDDQYDTFVKILLFQTTAGKILDRMRDNQGSSFDDITRIIGPFFRGCGCH